MHPNDCKAIVRQHGKMANGERPASRGLPREDRTDGVDSLHARTAFDKGASKGNTGGRLWATVPRPPERKGGEACSPLEEASG